MKNYVYRRGDNFYYRRRVPGFVMPYETRTEIKVSLATKSEKEALRKASIYNDYIEDYWASLIKGHGTEDPEEAYQNMIKLAKAHGFAYKSVADIAKEPIEQIVERLKVASKAIEKPEVVTSVLGGADVPKIMLKMIPEKFWPLCGDRLVNKSEHQITKWRNPRQAAMGHLIKAVGNKSLDSFNRSDVLKYRAWWMKRVEKGEVVAATVNKNMLYVKDMLQLVAMNNQIDSDFDVMFSKVRLKEVEASRPPFDAQYVQDVLLSPTALS